MKKTRLFKQILTILLIALILLIVNSGVVSATLQANKNTQYKKKDAPENWIKNFREMEKVGQTMGLNEELEEDLTSKNNTSNNIDVHMMRTTEYGAIAILSASGYGNPSNDRTITSTTGNATGIMLDSTSWEWTAGGLESAFPGVNSKYYDKYLDNQAKAGDGLGASTGDNPGCRKWHSAINNEWVTSNASVFGRGGNGIFSFGKNDAASFGWINPGVLYARGVAVCGTGL